MDTEDALEHDWNEVKRAILNWREREPEAYEAQIRSFLRSIEQPAPRIDLNEAERIFRGEPS